MNEASVSLVSWTAVFDLTCEFSSRAPSSVSAATEKASDLGGRKVADFLFLFGPMGS